MTILEGFGSIGHFSTHFVVPSHPLTAPLLHTHLTLVETAEPELLEELLADRRVGPLLAARLSDCVAVVAPGHARETLLVDHHPERCIAEPPEVERAPLSETLIKSPRSRVLPAPFAIDR
jgi:hypothetical protein